MQLVLQLAFNSSKGSVLCQMSWLCSTPSAPLDDCRAADHGLLCAGGCIANLRPAEEQYSVDLVRMQHVVTART